VRAAKLLHNDRRFHFHLVGDGQTRGRIDRLVDELELQNISFYPSKPYEEVLSCTKKADLSLGIFGNTEKGDRVIPNKVIESLGLSSIVITGRNRPMDREFAGEKNIFFCRRGDHHDLARVIKKVAQLEDDEREVIQQNARTIIKKLHSKNVLEKKIIEIIL